MARVCQTEDSADPERRRPRRGLLSVAKGTAEHSDPVAVALDLVPRAASQPGAEVLLALAPAPTPEERTLPSAEECNKANSSGQIE